MSSTRFTPGQSVELKDNTVAVVRFVGTTSFADGEWIGVELPSANGKNDGTVQGHRYFNCPPAHGLFLRPSACKAVQAVPKKRMSSVAAPKLRTSIAPPSIKAPRASVARRTTMAPPAAPPSAPSRSTVHSPVAPVISSAPSPPAGPSPPPTLPSVLAMPSATPRLSTTADDLASRAVQSIRQSIADPSLGLNRVKKRKSPSPPPSSVAKRQTLSPPQPSTTSSSTRDGKAQPPPQSAPSRETEEIRTRLTKVQGERDRYEAIIHRLQEKLQPLQQENASLRKQLKESNNRIDQVETMQAEHDSVMEMVTLDREMAEEKAEALKAEADALRQKNEELELENEILREENQELGHELSPEERASKGWLQMEQENDRLRQALIRLRDISQDQESRLKDQIKDLETDLGRQATVTQQLDDTRANLLEAQADNEDLRQQLDAALSAETIIEELTEKNLSLTEQGESAKNTIAELENLLELSNELETNYVEHEKQLHAAIEQRDASIAEQNQRITGQNLLLADQDYTISRFRELVSVLQSDMEELKASKRITESEVEELNSRSRAMLDLNKQLQTSALSRQANAIAMELRTLEAQEASRHLSIVQAYLPESYRSQKDSVAAYLCLQRVVFKARLLHSVIKDKFDSSPTSHMQQDGFTAFAFLKQLMWVTTMGDRLVQDVSTCPPKQFQQYGSALADLEVIERVLDGSLQNLKKGDARESLIVAELQRSISVMTHLAEHYLQGGVATQADDMYARATVIRGNLEIVVSALLVFKDDIATTLPLTNEDSEEFTLVQTTETAVALCRSATVIVGKAIRSLQDLKARFLSLPADTLPNFENCQAASEELWAYIYRLGESVSQLLHEEARPSPPTLSDVTAIIRHTSQTIFSASESEPVGIMTSKIRSLIEQLTSLHTICTDLSRTVEFERTSPPWVIHSKQLQQSNAASVEAEAERARLADEVHERTTQLRLREQALEEAGVKIELLESRSKDASKKAEHIRELETEVKEISERTRILERQLAQVAEERERLERERDTLKGVISQGMTETQSVRGMTAEDLRRLKTLEEEISVLESTNRYLRAAARREADEKIATSVQFLEVPVTSQHRATSLTPIDAVAPVQQRSMRTFEKIASLPRTLKALNLAPLPGNRLEWMPKHKTPQYQLCELDINVLAF